MARTFISEWPHCGQFVLNHTCAIIPYVLFLKIEIQSNKFPLTVKFLFVNTNVCVCVCVYTDVFNYTFFK